MSPFEAKLADRWPPADWADVTVLLAVSGGADSVALLRAAEALKRKTGGAGRLAIAHFNHRLRGPEADADEAFVAALCERLGIVCEVGRAELRAADMAGGIEAAARQARYAFLADAAGRLGARLIATAHTADDQAETILHRIVRGTGIAGLAGVPRVRMLGPFALVRPLLDFRRAEVLAYLGEIGQDFCHDASNDSPDFTRNRIRRDLLPRLAEQFNPEVVESLLRLGRLAGDVQAVVDSLVDALLDRCVARGSEGAILVRAAEVAGQPRYLVREVLIAAWRTADWPLQAMGFAEWDALAEMAQRAAEPAFAGKRCFPGAILAAAADGVLRMQPAQKPFLG
jgi:tRNA(Ile)-lysidine synthase